MKQGNLSSGNLPEQSFKEQNQFHVDKSGSDIKGTGADEKPVLTIAKALTLASQADAIIVNEGTYAETVTLATQNQTIRGEGDEYGGLTEINALNATANGTSVRASRLTVLGNVNHSGNSPLYLSEMTVVGNYVSSSIAYAEIKHSRLQSGTISKNAAGILYITDSLIGNATFSTANSVISLRNVTIDAGKAVTIGPGVIYSMQDVVGAVSIDPAAIPLETALLAQGATAEVAKAGQTSSFNMLRMLDPDTNASPTKFVSYNETTKRLEISDKPVSGGSWYTGTNTPAATGNTATSLGITTLPAFYKNTTNGNEYYVDASGVSYLIEKGYITTSLTPVYGNGTSYIGASNTALATAADQMRLSDGSIVDDVDVTWTGHGLPIHNWYYLNATTGTYTNVKPTSGYIQQLFFVKDANTIHVDIEQMVEATTSSDLVRFGSSAPTSTTGVLDGTQYFVTSDGSSTGTITAQYVFDSTTNAWISVPTSSSLTTTSLTPKTGNGTSYVAPTLVSETTLVDVIQLSDGTYVHSDKVTWTAHGLPIHTYFFASATAPYYTATAPTIGYSQQLFFTIDANTIAIDIEEGVYVDGTVASTTAGKMVSGMVSAGVSVTMDDLMFQIPTSGNRSLQVKTSTGTVSLIGEDMIYANNSTTATAAPATLLSAVSANSTTWQYINSTVNFAGQGNVQRVEFIDTTRQRFYRVTMIINAGYVNNFISIERLY